ncbi:MAG: hypothetical protein JNM56_07225 [Planctomycetia bacterium]|nr:hypothetical protein [Planctomycetia bacterium]
MNQTVVDREPAAEFTRPDSHSIEDVLFTPDGKHLVGLGQDRQTKNGVIDFWDVQSRKLARQLTQPGPVVAATFSSNGKVLLTSGWDKKLYIRTAPDWAMQHAFDHDPPGQVAQKLALLPSGKQFASGNSSYDGPRLWTLETRTARALKGVPEQVSGLAVSSDGKRLAVVYSAPVAEIWDLERFQVVKHLALEKGARRQGVFVSCAFSPDGRWFAAGWSGTAAGPKLAVTIWDANTFAMHKECDGLTDFPYALAFSADSKLLVSTMGGERNTPAKVCLWEAESGKLAHAFSPYKHGCMQQALSPDGRWLVTCGVDCTLRLWDFDKLRKELGR